MFRAERITGMLENVSGNGKVTWPIPTRFWLERAREAAVTSKQLAAMVTAEGNKMALSAVMETR
jgi:hypothetical protein